MFIAVYCMKQVFNLQAKHKLVLGREILVGKPSDETFLVVGHQVCTKFRRGCGPFLVTESLSILSFFLHSLETQNFRCLQRFPVGLESGNREGHSMTLISFLFIHSFVALVVSLGYLSWCKTRP